MIKTKLNLRRLHRTVSLAVVAYVLMATISGLIHILMSNFYSPPPPMLPQSNLSIGTIQYPISEIARYIPTPRSVALREVKGEIYYQVLPQEGKARYFHTISGAEIDLDASYAMQIASNYLPKKKLKHAAYLSSFDGEYLNIFRALPVYRIDVDDESGERIYVSTNTGSVTLYLNNIRAFGQHSFSNLHKLSFIPNKTIRDVVQVILVLMIVATTIMGLIIGLRR